MLHHLHVSIFCISKSTHCQNSTLHISIDSLANSSANCHHRLQFLRFQVKKCVENKMLILKIPVLLVNYSKRRLNRFLSIFSQFPFSPIVGFAVFSFTKEAVITAQQIGSEKIDNGDGNEDSPFLSEFHFSYLYLSIFDYMLIRDDKGSFETQNILVGFSFSSLIFLFSYRFRLNLVPEKTCIRMTVQSTLIIFASHRCIFSLKFSSISSGFDSATTIIFAAQPTSDIFILYD